MNVLKKIFPVSFMPTFLKSGGYLALGILLHFAAGIVCAPICAILAFTIIGAIVGPLVGLYLTAGIVIMILVFAKVIKVDEAEAVEAPAAEAPAAEAPAAEAKAEETTDAE